MASIVINDLEINKDLDQVAQEKILGGRCYCHYHRRRRSHRFYRRSSYSHWRGQALMNLAKNNGYTGGGVKTWYRNRIGYDPFRY